MNREYAATAGSPSERIGDYTSDKAALAGKLKNTLASIEDKATEIGVRRRKVTSIDDPIRRQVEEIDVTLAESDIRQSVRAVAEAASKIDDQQLKEQIERVSRSVQA